MKHEVVTNVHNCTAAFNLDSLTWNLFKVHLDPHGDFVRADNNRKLYYIGGEKDGRKTKTIYEMMADYTWMKWPMELPVEQYVGEFWGLQEIGPGFCSNATIKNIKSISYQDGYKHISQKWKQDLDRIFLEN